MSGADDLWFSTKDTIDMSLSMHSKWVKCAVIFCKRLKWFFICCQWVKWALVLNLRHIISNPYFMYSWWDKEAHIIIYSFAISGLNEQWFSTSDITINTYLMHIRWVKCKVTFVKSLILSSICYQTSQTCLIRQLFAGVCNYWHCVGIN